MDQQLRLQISKDEALQIIDALRDLTAKKKKLFQELSERHLIRISETENLVLLIEKELFKKD